GTVTIWRLDGGELSPRYEQTLGDYVYLSAPALGDLDGDGKKEIVVNATDYSSSYGTTDLYVLGRHGVLRGFPQRLNDGQLYISAPANPSLGDLDGDGELEIAVSGMSGMVSVFHRNGRLLRGWPRPTARDPA